MQFIQVKALAGVNFVRAQDVLAVQYADRDRCTLVMTGGVTLACVEAAATIAARIEAAVGAEAAAVPDSAIKSRET